MIKKIIIIGVILMLPSIVFAQAVPPPMGPPPPPGLPIDGFKVILFLIGMIYGSVKIMKESSS